MACRSLCLCGLVLLTLSQLVFADEPRELTAEQRKQLEDSAAKLNTEAVTAFRAGRLADAIPLMQRSVAEHQRLYPKEQYPDGHVELARVLNNLGVVLQARASYAEAEAVIRQALAMRQRLYPKEKYPDGHPDLAGSLNELAGVLKMREAYDEAEPFIRQALAMYQRLYPKEKHPNGHFQVAISLNNLAQFLHERGSLDEAEPFCRDALEMRRRLFPREQYPNGHPHLAGSINNLGALLKARGQYEQAEPFYREALAMYRLLYPSDKYPDGHPELASSLANLGGLLRARRAYEEAEPIYREALAMYQSQAERLAASASEAVALNYASTFPLVRDAHLHVSLQLARPDENACDVVWQSKAALTRVYQRRQLALLAARSSDTGRQLWDELLQLRRRREHWLLAPRSTSAAERDRQLHELGQAIALKEQQLRKLLPSAVPQPPARVAALRQALPPGSALVDLLAYVQLETDPNRPGDRWQRYELHYLAFVVTGETVRRVELGLAQPINEAVQAWREAITAWRSDLPESARRDGEARADRHAEQVRRLVWEPIARHLPARTATVWLAPDATLTQVPWAALPGSRPGTVLLEDHAVAVVPHAPHLLDGLTRIETMPPGKGKLLAVGGVAYGERTTEDRLNWPALEGTRREVQSVVQQAQGSGRTVTLLAGAAATTARVLQELPGARYAHLATHGFFADRQFRAILQLDEKLFEQTLKWTGAVRERKGVGAQHPLVLSGLVFAGANRNDAPDRGVITAETFVGLPLEELDLVVLSACESGLGDVAAGEGVYGLQRAFHLAGARSVVASLWKVDDEATAALMTLFYRHLWEDKLSSLEALRRAQLAVYRHPEHVRSWAKGERGPNLKPRPATSPSLEPTPIVKPMSTAPVKLWASFVLSGPGR